MRLSRPDKREDGLVHFIISRASNCLCRWQSKRSLVRLPEA
jgi:hypothetical protein